MKLKLNYLIIPLITLVVSVVGSTFTSGGMEWYKTINLPAWTPPGSIIGAVWTTIFILTAISALIVWNNISHKNKIFNKIIAVFLLNAFLNVLWSFIFFSQHLIGPAVVEAAVLGLSVIALIILIYPYSKSAALLLAPYAIWVTFATYLTYAIYLVNQA